MFPNYDKRAKSVQEMERLYSQILSTLPASLNHLVRLFNSNRQEMMGMLVLLEDEGRVKMSGGELWYPVKKGTPKD